MLLTSPSFDVRLEAQHELVARGGVSVATLRTALEGGNPRAARHGLWGLAQLTSVEDEALSLVVRVLAPDLLARLEKDRASHGRRPRNLTVRFRRSGSLTMNNPNGATTGVSATRSISLPQLSWSGAAAGDVRALSDATMSVLREALRGGPFCLTHLGIGATNFEAAPRILAAQSSATSAAPSATS